MIGAKSTGDRFSIFMCELINDASKSLADTLPTSRRRQTNIWTGQLTRRRVVSGSIVFRRVRLQAALRRMITVCHQSTVRVIRLLSYRSCSTLSLYSDHSAHRCFKSNLPIVRCCDELQPMRARHGMRSAEKQQKQHGFKKTFDTINRPRFFRTDHCANSSQCKHHNDLVCIYTCLVWFD